MAVDEICIGSKQDPSEKSSLHLINCKLASSGSNHPVAQYFDSQLQFENNVANSGKGANNLKASFRGRPLNGKKIQLPEGFAFARVSKSENENQLVASDLSKEATYWNLDKLPSSNDPVPQALQWLQLSADIHSHVQLDD